MVEPALHHWAHVSSPAATVRRSARLQPHFLAMILFDKFGQHLPFNRQTERFEREGVSLSLSTVADALAVRCILKRITVYDTRTEVLERRAHI